MPVITLTTTAIVAGVTFCLQGINAWRGKVNGEKIREINYKYEKKMREHNDEESQKLLQQMLDARKQIAEQEQAETLELLKASHEESIKDIAEKAFFSKWPLHIHPIVIRNDFPLSSIEDLQRNDVIEPVHLIIAPTRDKSFRNTIEPIITEKLNNVFSTFYNSRNSHRVIFYKDVWIDETLDADETIVRNIYSRTKLTPTILISFKVKNDKIVLEVSHWGINGFDNSLNNIGSVFCQNIDIPIYGSDITRNKQYDLVDIEIISAQLVDFVSLITGMLVDKLMWYRYRLSPVLPKTIKNGMLKLGQDELKSINEFYSDLLSDSFESGLISRFVDYKGILAYCSSVDIPLSQNRNFLNIFFGEDKISTFSAFPVRIQYGFLRYIGANKKLYQAETKNKELIKSFYKIWLTTSLRQNVVYAAANEPEYSFRTLKEKFGASVWKPYWDDQLLIVAHKSIDSALSIIKPIDDVMFPRIKMRKALTASTENAIRDSIIPNDCKKVISHISKFYTDKYNSLISKKLNELIPLAEEIESTFKNIDLTFDLQNFEKDLLRQLETSLNAKLSELNINEISENYKSNIHEILTSLNSWSYKISKDWIEYHFMGNDILRDNLSNTVKEEQDSRIRKDFDSLSMVILDSLIRKVQNLSPRNTTATGSSLALAAYIATHALSAPVYDIGLFSNQDKKK